MGHSREGACGSHRLSVADQPVHRQGAHVPVRARGSGEEGRRRLFCACDGGRLLAVSLDSGEIVTSAELTGVPDVIFWNEARRHVYVAVGEPCVIDIFDADDFRRLAVVKTELGTHTMAFDPMRDLVYAFMPQSHSAAVCAAGA